MSASTKKVLGVFGLLMVTCIATSIFSDVFLSSFNIENLLRRTALFGIISIGAAFVIIVGGIDLSIGSVIALVGCLLPWLLTQQGWSPWAAVPIVLLLGLVIGLVHGLLITQLGIQPFIVTLCGLLIYRGLARGITGDQTVGFLGKHPDLRFLGDGSIPITEGFSLPASLRVSFRLYDWHPGLRYHVSPSSVMARACLLNLQSGSVMFAETKYAKSE